MEAFKVPDTVPPGFTLRRVSYLARTVRYQWNGPKGPYYGPVFQATLQEWERATDA